MPGSNTPRPGERARGGLAPPFEHRMVVGHGPGYGSHHQQPQQQQQQQSRPLEASLGTAGGSVGPGHLTMAAAARILSVIASPERTITEAASREEIAMLPQEGPCYQVDVDEEEDEEEDEGRRLLRTWTTIAASPSPRRRLPRGSKNGQLGQKDVVVGAGTSIGREPDSDMDWATLKLPVGVGPDVNQPREAQQSRTSSISGSQTVPCPVAPSTAAIAATAATDAASLDSSSVHSPRPMGSARPPPQLPVPTEAHKPRDPASLLADLTKILEPGAVPLLPAGLYSILDRIAQEGTEQLAGTRRGQSQVAELCKIGEMRQDELSSTYHKKAGGTRMRGPKDTGKERQGTGGRLVFPGLGKRKRDEDVLTENGRRSESEGREVCGIFVYETGRS